MAPLPKRRHSTRRQGARRAGLMQDSTLALSRCKACGAAKISRYPCPNCGFYSESTQLPVKTKKHENRA